ncbi:hypothetical protein [Niabella beijingensis]|uniref:hypothetical protein n=1 Tax=Niabella beijingensis TaxID=2872700 RepID=UPI001CBC22A6|nr:hypothetical protein [Niabella beijingensis]MBZ4187342.1 hypothetical protein [Niabella beijingensis]
MNETFFLYRDELLSKNGTAGVPDAATGTINGIAQLKPTGTGSKKVIPFFIDIPDRSFKSLSAGKIHIFCRNPTSGTISDTKR